MKLVRDLVIIGGGFIGVEFADECRKGRDINMTVVEALPHCLQMALDDEFCVEAEKKLTETGVKILLNTKVEAILGNDRFTEVELTGGVKLKADMIILGIGAVPNTELARKAGIQLGFNNTIKVDVICEVTTIPMCSPAETVLKNCHFLPAVRSG